MATQVVLAPDLGKRGANDFVFVDVKSMREGELPRPFPAVAKDDPKRKNTITLPFSTKRGISVVTSLKECLEKLSEPQQSIQDVSRIIESHQPTSSYNGSLYELFNQLSPELRAHYLNDVIPKMAKLTLRLNELITQPIPRLRRDDTASLTFSQEQVACLLAHAFFCTFPPRERECAPNMQIFSFTQLFLQGHNTKIEKLKCLMRYFDSVTSKMPDGLISIRRNHYDQMVDFSYSRDRLCDLIVHENDRIEDTNNEMLEIDFADRYIGGLTLSVGCVQEEIRFVISPELLVSILVCERMEDNESISIVGAQRFSDYEGYGKTFRYVERAENGPPMRDRFNRITSEVVGIDAINLSEPMAQFENSNIVREIQKACAGFQRLDALNRPLATGNWGCGAFGGDRELKSMIQLIAASVCGRKTIHYFTFSDVDFANDLKRVYHTLVKKKTTCGALTRLLLAYRPKDDNFQLFNYITRELTHCNIM